ncbi:hypothetical protein BSKO_00141 [Bryopsis sp. KO-2023]|nr:hypothetical protein BSKO_00141 [Bryopsis sp. KO-2023]
MTTESLGESLIPVINKLQDIFSQVTLDFKLDLPQVAVVGSQSSGKSSVLEALVGRDFLPRGPEICTRRPLVLQLVRTEEKDGEDAEWGEFLHCKGKKFFDFEKIREEIAAETERVAGKSKAIDKTPIRLKICSRHVLTMTLVDLPGITRVPVGDQPEDIEAKIRDMIMDFIKHPTCIILAVSPANVDLANSDALQMAQSADPEGKRTIGVLTKLDIMDRGTNAVPILKNLVVPLRLGYIGIVNRSQGDINENKNITQARKNESDFFRGRLEYRDVSNQCGIENLAKRLNSILVAHIQAMLPGLRFQINKELERRNTELREYGDPPPTDSTMGRGAMLLGLLSEYCQRFSAMLDGRSESVLIDLAGGAKIRDIFQNQFVKYLQEMDWRNDLSNEVIRTTIRNSSGVSGSLLIPQEPFELLVRRSIKRLLEPAVRCKDLVQNELLRIAVDCAPHELSRFNALQRSVADSVTEYIRAGGEPAEQMIRMIIDCEYDYINYDHPSFIGGPNAVAEVLADKKMRTLHKSENGAREHSEGGNAELNPRQKGMNDGHPHHQATVIRNARTPRVESAGAPPKLGLKSISEPPGLGTMIRSDAPVRADAAPDENSQGRWFSSLFQRGNGHTENGVGGMDYAVAGISGVPPMDPSMAMIPMQGMTLMDQRKDTYGQMETAVEITRKLVDNYMSLVQSNVSDMVPKAIMHHLVHRSRRGLQQHLIGTLYKEELFLNLMSEREDVMIKRKSCQAALKALREAVLTLDTLPQDLCEKMGPAARISTPQANGRDFDRHPLMVNAARATQNAMRGSQGPLTEMNTSNPFDFPS